MLSSSMAVCPNDLPAGMTTLPLLSFSGPLKITKVPSMNLALTASAAFLAASLTAGPYGDVLTILLLQAAAHQVRHLCRRP